MKKYQDTATGEIYEFAPYVDVENLMKTNRRLPKTLVPNVKQKPSDDHVWLNGGWVHKIDAPNDYTKPVSSVPVYDPAWVIFLYEHPTIISDDPKDADFTLEQINENNYDRRVLSSFVTTLKDVNGSCELDFLVTMDGSISIPISNQYPTAEKAIIKFNHIVSALFLGGIVCRPIDVMRLEQGHINENGSGNSIFTTSDGNLFRLGGKSKVERIKLHNVIHIPKNKFVASYNAGSEIISSTGYSPLFFVKGYDYLRLYKSAEAMSNLWIVVEQLIEQIYNKHIDCFNRQTIKICSGKYISIHKKLSLLKHYEILPEDLFNTLDQCRSKRNSLVHKGRSPKIHYVEKLWVVIFDLFKLAFEEHLLTLRKLTIKDNKFIRHSTSINTDAVFGRTDFTVWESVQSKFDA